MYCIKVMYPKKPGSSVTFNLKHYLEVHVPLGLSLFRQHMGFSPVRTESDVNCSPLGGGTAHYHVIASLYFRTRQEADGFTRLFGIPEVAARLKADWPNFTELDPEVIGSEVVDLDPSSGSRL